MLVEPSNRKNEQVIEEHLRTITELRNESLAKDEEIAALKRQLQELANRFEK